MKSRLALFLTSIAVALTLAFAIGATWWGLGDAPSQVSAVPTPNSATQSDASQQLEATLVWALIASLAISIISLSVTLRLLFWRKALKGGQTSVVPNQLISDFTKLSNKLNENSAALQQSFQEFSEYRQKNSRNMQQVQDAFRIFYETLDKKDAEIERLKRGGDSIVFQRFLSRFLRLHSAFQTELADCNTHGGNPGPLKDLSDLLEDALLDCGVEQLVPKVGAPFGSEFGVSDNPKVIKTEDEEKHLKIAEVIRAGFLLKTASTPICLQPAQVAIYKLEVQEPKA